MGQRVRERRREAEVYLSPPSVYCALCKIIDAPLLTFTTWNTPHAGVTPSPSPLGPRGHPSPLTTWTPPLSPLGPRGRAPRATRR